LKSVETRVGEEVGERGGGGQCSRLAEVGLGVGGAVGAIVGGIRTGGLGPWRIKTTPDLLFKGKMVDRSSTHFVQPFCFPPSEGRRGVDQAWWAFAPRKTKCLHFVLERRGLYTPGWGRGLETVPRGVQGRGCGQAACSITPPPPSPPSHIPEPDPGAPRLLLGQPSLMGGLKAVARGIHGEGAQANSIPRYPSRGPGAGLLATQPPPPNTPARPTCS
jgi:hypothetical protein